MSRILFAGVYREGTGWGTAAIANLRALRSVGLDVVARPIILGNNVTPPSDILELEAKSASGCDVVIQHALPHQMDFHGDFRKNIAIYESETSHFRHSNWADRLNTMSECWVPNRQMVDAARTSGVTVPVHVVRHACDTSLYGESHGVLEHLQPFKERGDFLFYFVGENVRRKNLEALIKAFHLTFHPDEPVQLVIKSSVPKLSPAEAAEHIRTLCSRVKRDLKLYGQNRPYKPEIIITDRLTKRGMIKLHKSCDCFVMPSCGEAWCYPALDAMAMGKTPIVPASTGFLEYLSREEGWLVNTFTTPVIGATDTFGDLFVASETWQTIDVIDLGRCMREAFEKSDLREEKAANGIDKALNFSYTSVGLQMANLLAQP